MAKEINLGQFHYSQEFREKISNCQLKYHTPNEQEEVLINQKTGLFEPSPMAVSGCILGGVGTAYLLGALGYPEVAVFGGIGGLVAGGIAGEIYERRLVKHPPNKKTSFGEGPILITPISITGGIVGGVIGTALGGSMEAVGGTITGLAIGRMVDIFIFSKTKKL